MILLVKCAVVSSVNVLSQQTSDRCIAALESFLRCILVSSLTVLSYTPAVVQKQRDG